MARSLLWSLVLLATLAASAHAQRTATILGQVDQGRGYVPPQQPMTFQPAIPAPNVKTTTTYVNLAQAMAAVNAGYVVTGTSGADKDGFAQWISSRSATMQGTEQAGYAGTEGRWNSQHPVDLGQESGWVQVDRTQIEADYYASVARADNYLAMIRDAEQRLQAARTAYAGTQNPGHKAIFAQQYQEANGALLSFAKMRESELGFQKSLRPGR